MAIGENSNTAFQQAAGDGWKASEYRTVQEMRRRNRKKLILLSICVFFVLISIPRLKNLISYYRKLQYYNTEIIRLRAENEVLREKIRTMKEDPYYAEKMLRENHGYVKEGEHVYRINEKRNQNPSP